MQKVEKENLKVKICMHPEKLLCFVVFSLQICIYKAIRVHLSVISRSKLVALILRLRFLGLGGWFSQIKLIMKFLHIVRYLATFRYFLLLQTKFFKKTRNESLSSSILGVKITFLRFKKDLFQVLIECIVK